MHVSWLFVCTASTLSVACGGRSALLILPPGDSPDASLPDGVDASDREGPLEAGADVLSSDDATLPSGDAAFDAPLGPGMCGEGQNTGYPPSDCSGPSDYWLAGPYVSVLDISVTQIQIHTTGGNVALLTSSAGAPGTVLFMGSVAASATAQWTGTDVSPSVRLTAGVEYFLAEEASRCSQTSEGPEQVEYGASSLEGPWTVTGTDNWTARLIGTCP